MKCPFHACVYKGGAWDTNSVAWQTRETGSCQCNGLCFGKDGSQPSRGQRRTRLLIRSKVPNGQACNGQFRLSNGLCGKDKRNQRNAVKPVSRLNRCGDHYDTANRLAQLTRLPRLQYPLWAKLLFFLTVLYSTLMKCAWLRPALGRGSAGRINPVSGGNHDCSSQYRCRPPEVGAGIQH
jgi:hypothetical protein